MIGCKLLVYGALFVGVAWGHGMMMDPPNRSSMWRFYPDSPKNFNDNENFCGGFGIQWGINGGKCGVCGDDFRAPIPRPNENTGRYGQGKIAKTYNQGEVIEANVLLTANHRGYFEFSLCVLQDANKPEDDSCFQLLKLADGRDKYTLPGPEKGYYKVQLQLPPGVSGKRSVLRWHYHTGNTWGQCEDGHQATGCGPQETFRSCADISIL